MRVSGKYAVGAIFALAVAVTVAASALRFRQNINSARQALATARSELAAAQTFAAAQKAATEAAAAKADTFRAVAAQESARADTAEHTAAALRVRLNRLAANAPDTCGAIVAAADSALDAQDTTIAHLRGAVAAHETSEAELRGALSGALLAVDSLSRAASKVDTAAGAVVTAARGSWIERLAPKVGLGVAAGVDIERKPNVLAGITFGWTF